jgi:hypothetical protein
MLSFNGFKAKILTEARNKPQNKPHLTLCVSFRDEYWRIATLLFSNEEKLNLSSQNAKQLKELQYLNILLEEFAQNAKSHY